MRIKEINIAAFGGIKNLKLTPDSGFNVIYGDNENGKTTVMAFIKMMFYGNGRNSSDIAKNMRKKYTPWDGSVMAGSIDFEHSGRNYRIEREFRKSDATDRITLSDLDLGTRTVAPPDVGTKFLGLTAAGFERSVFIGQFGFPEGDPEGEIAKRLSNIVLTGDEAVSFETVNGRLSKAKTALMSKSGNAGAYDKKVKEIAGLAEKLKRSASVYDNYELVKARLQQTAGEILKMQQRADILKKKISAEQDIRNAQKLKELLDLKSRLDELNKELTLSDGNIADETYVKKLQFCISKAEASEFKLNSALKEIEILENSITGAESGSREEREAQRADTERSIQSLEQKRDQLSGKLKADRNEESSLILALSSADKFKKKANSLMLNSGSAIFVIAVVLGFLLASSVKWGMAAAIAVAVSGLIIFALGFVIRPTDKKAYEECKNKVQRLREEISESEFALNDITAEISLMKARLESVNAALSGNAELLAENKKRLLECKSELVLLTAETESDKNALHGLFSRYRSEFSPDDIKPAIEEISKGAAKQKELKQQINYILKDVGGISYAQAAEKLEKMENSADISADFEAIKAEYDNLISEIGTAKTNAATEAVRAEEAVAKEEIPEKIKRRITELTKEAQAQKEYCEKLQIAMDVLAESNIEVRRSFGSELEKKSAEILSRLTNGKYESMSISKTLDVAVEERDKFGSREIDYLSSGTADQAYLSLRLAISSLMAGDGEALPVLMDDALAQYDDTRMQTALKFLADYSKDNQIILFTCHNAMCQEAEKAGAKIYKL